MYPDESAFYRKCNQEGIILDANVLLTYLIGKVAGTDSIEIHGRAKYKGYIDGDYSIIEWLVEKSRKIITTRYILAEVSDMYPIEDNDKGKRYNSEKVLEEIKNIIEEDCASIDELTKNSITKIIGYADSSIAKISENKYAVLTIDGMLENLILEAGASVVNMNRLRVMYGRAKNGV